MEATGQFYLLKINEPRHVDLYRPDSVLEVWAVVYPLLLPRKAA